MNLLDYLYSETDETGWQSEFDAIHLMLGHRWYGDALSPIREFDAANIVDYPYTYGHMCRHVMKRIQKLKTKETRI